MIIKTYEDSTMSLCARGVMTIRGGLIESISFRGTPRMDGQDEWRTFYHPINIGKPISQETIDKILSYNGKNNVVSKIIQQ